MKLDLILENVRNKYNMGLLEESGNITETELLQGKILINESTMTIRSMLVEEGTLSAAREILEEAWIEALIEETAYEEYFDKKLKEAGYDNVKSIPEKEKAIFFEKVDAGWKSKEEEKTLEESSKIGGQVAQDVKKELLSRGADAYAISNIPLPFLQLAFGIISGLESGGNAHSVIGILLGQKAAMGAASNNLKGISLMDAYRDLPRSLKYGIFGGAGLGILGGPIGILVGAGIGATESIVRPAIQYLLGKLFGSNQSIKQYQNYLKTNSRILN